MKWIVPKNVNWRTHVRCWICWCLFYLYYVSRVARSVPFDWVDYFIGITVHISSFYLSAYWLFPRTLFAKPYFSWKLLFIALLEALVILLLLMIVSLMWGALKIGNDPHVQRASHIRNIDDIILMLYAGLGFAIVYVLFHKKEDQLLKAERLANELKEQLSRSEMIRINHMLIPHLTNNLLALLRDTVREHPEKTSVMMWLIIEIIHFYGRLDPEELILLRHELEVAGLWIDLQEMRLGQKAAIRIDAEEAALDLRILPMLLLLLLENMGKYAILTDVNNEALIRIYLKDGQLYIHSENQIRKKANFGYSSKKGLKSIGKRLKSLGLDFSMLNNIANGRFTLDLSIQLV